MNAVFKNMIFIEPDYSFIFWNQDSIDEEDDNWWTAVEETASQSELIHFS
jgi:hypothetical protein